MLSDRNTVIYVTLWSIRVLWLLLINLPRREVFLQVGKFLSKENLHLIPGEKATTMIPRKELWLTLIIEQHIFNRVGNIKSSIGTKVHFYSPVGIVHCIIP